MSASEVLCLVTGQPTPIPKRGPRSQYVNRDASDLRSRLRQAEVLTQKLADDVGFTPEARARFKRLLGFLSECARGSEATDRPRPTRRSKDGRARVRLPGELLDRIDALPGSSRTAKVEVLLVEALEARAAKGGAR